MSGPARYRHGVPMVARANCIPAVTLGMILGSLLTLAGFGLGMWLR